MIYTPSPLAISLFICIVVVVLVLSFYFSRRTKSTSGYYAAGGRIHWSVNGVAFAGDYLSAASFLGICGMIATFGYDGFLYSIGYLAGWIVALFVVAEPIKRLGKFTFSDAIDAKFGSRGIRLLAAISTLVVSVFYLIPQMVGAGSLVTPLLGLPHSMGVMMVGAIVIIIVATAGMASTTYVQFIKGGLLVIFSTLLVVLILARGFSTNPDQGGKVPYHEFKTLQATTLANGSLRISDPAYTAPANWSETAYGKAGFVALTKGGEESVWQVAKNEDGSATLKETLWVTDQADGTKLYNGAPASAGRFYAVGHIDQIVKDGKTVSQTGPLNPFSFLSILRESTITLWGKQTIIDGANHVTVYFQKPTSGSRVLRPGLKFKIDGASPLQRLDFISLMLALFCGTAALPHILIRYYTVPSPSAARKSTIVAIGVIGFFYVLTLFMGLGAMTSGVVNLLDDNMSAPLLAQSFGGLLFAVISAVAFATVLGTVSGLIVAATGAIAHDLMDRVMGMKDVRRSQGAGGQDVGRRHRVYRHRVGQRLRGHERLVPGRLGVRRGGFGQPAGDHHAVVLEEDHEAGRHGLHRPGPRLRGDPHPPLARHVREVRNAAVPGAHAAQHPGDHFDPHQLHRARRRFAADAARGSCERERSRRGHRGRGGPLLSDRSSQSRETVPVWGPSLCTAPASSLTRSRPYARIAFSLLMSSIMPSIVCRMSSASA